MKNFNKTLNITLLSIMMVSFQLSANDDIYQSRGISIGGSTQTVKKQALIVGVSNYSTDNADLKGIDKDVEKMKQLFLSWGFDVKVLYDEESMNIITYLNQYAKTLTTNDSFAFYYTGHGSHKADKSNDEADGQDETLVLSDGKRNKHLIDDILYNKFNDIKAKKLVFFDSCHSGTVFRALGSKTQAKTIRPEDVTDSFQMSSSKGISLGGDKMSSGDFVVFSSSQDTEESLATPTGSLFTNAITEVFSDRNLQNKSLNSINEILVQKVVAYAKKTDGIPHHPNINYSSSSIGNNSLQNFIATKKALPSASSSVATNNSLQQTFESMLDSNKFQPMSLNYNKTTYQTGNSIEFEVDTKQDKGYLTVFYVDKNDVTVLYPNPFVSARELQGKYKFPEDLANGQFELEAYKSCTGCQEEKTVIYTLLSASPISNIKSIQSKGLTSFGNNSNESKVISRAVRIKAKTKSNSGFKSQLGKYEFIVR